MSIRERREERRNKRNPRKRTVTESAERSDVVTESAVIPAYAGMTPVVNAPPAPPPPSPPRPAPSPEERDARPVVYAYARISTDESRQSLETQALELRDWTERAGYRLERVYADAASAGDMRGRTEWRRLIADLQAAPSRFRPVAVVCVRLDRFTRSVSDCANTLTLFDDIGVRLITADGILGGLLESSPAVAGLLRNIIAAFAEFEQALIRERVRAGMRRAAAEGKRLGRKPREIDWEAHAALPAGMSVRARAEALGVSHAVLNRQERERGLQIAPAPPPERGHGGKFRRREEREC